MARLARIAGIVGGIMLVAAGATTAGAASSGQLNQVRVAQPTPSPSPWPSESPSGGKAKAASYCQDYVRHLASDLGVSQDRVNGALKRSARQTVDDAVRNGDLTQQQARSARNRINGGDACTAAGRLVRGAHHRNGDSRGMAVTAAAQTLGISPKELRTDLSQGKSVSQVAPAGMTEEQFTSKFQTNFKRDLDAQVKAGKLTQAQENAALHHAPGLAHHLWTNGGHEK